MYLEYLTEDTFQSIFPNPVSAGQNCGPYIRYPVNSYIWLVRPCNYSSVFLLQGGVRRLPVGLGVLRDGAQDRGQPERPARDTGKVRAAEGGVREAQIGRPDQAEVLGQEQGET